LGVLRFTCDEMSESGVWHVHTKVISQSRLPLLQVIITYSVARIALCDSTDLIVIAERSLGKRWIESRYYGPAATGLLSKSSSA
jgi:hypothetical protein